MDYMKSLFAQYDIALTDHQAKQFLQYYEMLVEKNKVMNLTAITEYHEVVIKHFLDSVYLGKYENLNGECSLIDVGTGAGFPGIPLKILYPDLKVCLLDSLNKRVKFLNEVIEALSLDKIEAIHGRAEEIARKAEYREQFDYCVSRAVANMSSLSEICIPFVKENGYFIPYKSTKGREEVELANKAITLLGGSIEDTIAFQIKEDDAEGEVLERIFVKIRKVKNTPKKYPRKPGTPFKEPLS